MTPPRRPQGSSFPGLTLPFSFLLSFPNLALLWSFLLQPKISPKCHLLLILAPLVARPDPSCSATHVVPSTAAGLAQPYYCRLAPPPAPWPSFLSSSLACRTHAPSSWLTRAAAHVRASPLLPYGSGADQEMDVGSLMLMHA